MAQINLTRVGLALGVGVADEVLERMPLLPQIGPWSAQDAARLVAVLIGHALTLWGPQNRMTLDLSEGIAMAATPLLVKTLAQQVMPVAASASTRVSFTPRRQSGARAEDWAPSGGKSQYRSIS